MINKNAKNNNVLNIIKSSKIRLVFAFLFLVIAGLTLALISPKESFIKTTARKLFSGNNPVSSVEITTDDYDNEGSIKVTKEAYWVSKTEAELNINLETIRKTGDNKKDIILVFDVSGSMEGEKLDKVKQDASELIEYVLDKDEDNKVGLITFASESRIISPLTNNKEDLLESINNMNIEDATNYYLAYKDIETILDGYSKESGKDLVVLFMTDGVPTDGTSAQGVYEALKEQHPYITINSIEYEKGKTASDTISISDNQWVANMDTFNNVLFEATVSPETYERLKIIDYIDDEYFEIETNTPSKGSISLDNNKITWKFSDHSYVTGSKETLKIKLKLKDEYKEVKGLYPTNKKTEIEYKINEEKETTSTLTPILKNNYDVIYDINAPDTCSLEQIEGENHFLYDAVTIKDLEPKCTGYTFKGWKTEETNIKYKSEDTFIMPEHDVHIRAIWSKQTMKAYMDGTVYEKTTLYKTIENEDVKTGAAKLYTGEHQDSLIVPGTENIYYYNGNVTTNNVIFGDFCWKIVRTTDTGGVKLIYNGVPSNGTCNNTGEEVQIGKTSYNPSGSLSYVGYMYNSTYIYNTLYLSPRSTVIQRYTLNKNHYFSNSYEYNQSANNKYKLQDLPETEEDDRFTAEECITNGNCNEILSGTYTFGNTNPEYSYSTIRYIVGVIGEYIYYIDLINGQTLEDGNPMFFIGDGYQKNNDETYTIISDEQVEQFRKTEWINKYGTANKKYVCIGSNPCTEPVYVTATSIQTYNSENINNNYIYANDFDYVLNNDTGEYEYVLKDTEISNKEHIWDLSNEYRKLSKNHYTCFNTTGKCKEISYIFYTPGDPIYYITLKEGENINDALIKMTNSEDINLNDSLIKKLVDTWYENNIISFENYIEDVSYCNDRSISNNGGWNPNGGDITSVLYFSGSNTSRYQLKCNQQTDNFQVNNLKAKLKYPVGLITADEVSLAYKDSIRAYYLRIDTKSRIITPYDFRPGCCGSANVYSINTNGDLIQYWTNESYGVRPVISLKPEIEYTAGDGTKNNPYVIDTSS